MLLMKKLLKMVFGRFLLVAILIIAQLAFLIYSFIWLQGYYHWLYFASTIVSILFIIFIISDRSNPSYKITWLILILLSPVLGGVLYIIFGNNLSTIRKQKKLRPVNRSVWKETMERQQLAVHLTEAHPDAAAQSQYIFRATGYPAYQDTISKFYSSGEEFLPDFMNEIENAKKFIFLEYFIIDKGTIWNGILEVLKRKVKEGLDVRIVYDDMGCIGTLPGNYYKQLRRLGIQCYAFNRFVPLVNGRINNRDHRKISVIDGNVGFTGGINLADEYFNVKKVYGYWKDDAIMIKGDAVRSFTLMFLNLWDSLSKKEDDFRKFMPEVSYDLHLDDSGFVQPYCDAPMDNETVGENVYLNMICRAKKSICITTPYLIIDNEMITALTNAAKQGIDVKIVTPSIPDKKTVFMITRSYYRQLVEAGVHVYEYKPGFIHQKIFVVDDEYATIGTINLDFRSLFLHFENGVWLFQGPIIKTITSDFAKTLRQSNEMTLAKCHFGLITRFVQKVLRIFAPML